MSTLQPARSRVKEHIHLLGILWLAVSALNAAGGVIALIVANTLLAHMGELGAPAGSAGFLRPLVSVVAILIMAKAAFGLLAGWGLLHRESWARTLAVVLAFLSLLNVPFGTAIGIYTLWVLLPGPSEREYEDLVVNRAA